MEKVQAANSVSSTGTASLQGSLTETCGLAWVSQIASDSKQLNSREGKSKKREICGFQTKQ